MISGWDLFSCAIFGFCFGCILGAWFGDMCCNKHLRNAAIKAGAAHWELTSPTDPTPRFVWNGKEE